jgi:F0F1-type ATP synthase membrane subunit b/b'
MTTGTGTGAETRLGTETGAGIGDDASAKERAQQAASTAADEGKHVAGVVAEEATSIADEAKDHARNLVSEARSQLQGQVDDQSRQQKDMLVGTLSTFGDDLASMAQNGSGLAADVAHQVAERANSLSRHLDGREPSDLLDDVRRFARQRPGTFLLGALAAGVIVGRLARGTKDAIEAAEGTPDARIDDAPRVTPSAAPDTTVVHASHAQPTQPPIDPGSAATGYSSPPVGTELPSSPSSGPQGGPTA